MFTLSETATFDQEIKKSRFVAFAGPVADETSARAFLAAHSDSGANHNCWAWRIGQIYRFSDDGEPTGTAGKPILQAIDGQSLDGVAVVVTRWFGGILLGSGGLMRAYGGTAASCLRLAARHELVATLTGSLRCSFGDLALVKARLAGANVSLLGEVFDGEGAILTVALPEADAQAVGRLVADLTGGRSALRLADPPVLS